MRETRIAWPLTTHRNREVPEIFLALASTTVFSAWTAQRMSCNCVSGPPRTKSPFSVMIFCHRSRNPTTSMMIPGFVTIIVIEVSYVWQKKISFGPKCHGCVFFFVVRLILIRRYCGMKRPRPTLHVHVHETGSTDRHATTFA